jgi:hypothetical protein
MADMSVMQQLAPSGKLRVAIAVAPSPSAQFAVKDGTGFKGVAVTLRTALAEKLGVEAQIMPHQASGEIQNSAPTTNGMLPSCLLTKSAKSSSISATPIIFCPSRPRSKRVGRAKAAPLLAKDANGRANLPHHHHPIAHVARIILNDIGPHHTPG